MIPGILLSLLWVSPSPVWEQYSLIHKMSDGPLSPMVLILFQHLLKFCRKQLQYPPTTELCIPPSNIFRAIKIFCNSLLIFLSPSDREKDGRDWQLLMVTSQSPCNKHTLGRDIPEGHLEVKLAKQPFKLGQHLYVTPLLWEPHRLPCEFGVQRKVLLSAFRPSEAPQRPAYPIKRECETSYPITRGSFSALA